MENLIRSSLRPIAHSRKTVPKKVPHYDVPIFHSTDTMWGLRRLAPFLLLHRLMAGHYFGAADSGGLVIDQCA